MSFTHFTPRDAFQVLGAIVICQLAGVLGSVVVTTIPNQYAALIRPELAPPGWVFGPVWLMLYTLMGIAAWLIYRQGWQKPEVRRALAVFGMQLLLNAVWTPIFFGWGNYGIAFAEIALLWVAIVVTMVLFWKLSRPATALLIPYLLWVSFASYLNFAIWQLNS